MAQTNFAIDHIQENVNNLSRSLLSNDHVRAYLSIKDIQNTTPVLASREIHSQLVVLSYYVDRVCLYNSQLDLLYNSKDGHQWTPELYDDPELAMHLRDPEFLMKNNGKPVVTSRDSRTGNADIIRYYYTQSTAPNSAPNAIVIDIHMNALTDSILNIQQLSDHPASSFLLMDDQNTYITSVLDSFAAENDGWLDAAIARLSLSDNPVSSYVKINGTRYLQIHTISNAYGWLLVNFIPVRMIFQDVQILHSIQTNIEHSLHFTVTIAFSPVFQGLAQLHSVYRNTENALLSKMRFGHNCIIDPYQLEEISREPFQFSYRSLNQIIDALAIAQLERLSTATGNPRSICSIVTTMRLCPP